MNKTLSEEIRLCQRGAVDNPYQGDDKKVLFVCSMGILRSATAARLYANKYNTRSAGTHEEALIPITVMLIEWANQIVFVNSENLQMARIKYYDFPRILNKLNDAVVLNIPDNYPHMHPQLVEEFVRQYEEL